MCSTSLFEIEVNSLGQLCINFANEKLIFNEVMLGGEGFAREAARDSARLLGDRQRACRELIEGKPRGLFALLEEECVVPSTRGSPISSSTPPAASTRACAARRR